MSFDLKIEFGPHEKPGKLIVVEGLDGSGKTTFVRALCTHIGAMGIEVYKTRFPSDSMRRSRAFQLFHRQRREDLVDALAFEVQYMADRIQHSRKSIAPRLREGVVVVSDRYAFSSVGVLVTRSLPLWDLATRSMFLDGWFRDLCRQLVAPDLSIFLHAPVDVTIERLQRRSKERDMPIDRDRLEELLELAKAIARANGMRLIDTSQGGPRRCVEAIQHHLDPLLSDVRSVGKQEQTIGRTA